MRLSRLRPRVTLVTVCLHAIVGVVVPAHRVEATRMVIINNDGPGEGLNDPTSVGPVGGNPGVTLGDQRLNALQRAADIWAGVLDSRVDIEIGTGFTPLFCGTYGNGIPANTFHDFDGAPFSGTWYPVALANALSGRDLHPGFYDIDATFNSALDDGSCPAVGGFYYGYDGNARSDQIDFVSVALHELGHGLGFYTWVDFLGAKLKDSRGRPLDDAFMRNLEDHTTGKLYPDMTDEERVAASMNTGNLHWIGQTVRSASGRLTSGRVGDHVAMFAPASPLAGAVIHWDTTLTPDELMEPFYTGVNHDVGLALAALQDLGWPVPHNLAVTKITAPATFTNGGGTKPVRVQIQNRGHAEVISAASLGDGMNSGVVRLAVSITDDDSEGCLPASVALDAEKNARLFENGWTILKPKGKLTITFRVTYECPVAKSRDRGDPSRGDYTHTAQVFHSVLGAPDGFSADDVCPHSASLPQKDRGCGSRRADGSFGDPVITNVRP